MWASVRIAQVCFVLLCASCALGEDNAGSCSSSHADVAPLDPDQDGRCGVDKCPAESALLQYESQSWHDCSVWRRVRAPPMPPVADEEMSPSVTAAITWNARWWNNFRSEQLGRKVTLVISSASDVQDGTFNSLAVKGASEACNEDTNCCLEIDAPHDNPRDYLCEMEYAALDSNLTIGVGFNHAAAAYAASRCSRDRSFAVVDAGYQSFPEDNLEGMIFDEAQAGFLAGVIAGMVMGAEAPEAQRVGVVLGTDSPPVHRMAQGFMNAAAAYCPLCEFSVEHCPDLQNTDNCGVVAAQRLVRAGSRLIFGVGGLTGSMAIKYAAAAEGTMLRLSKKQCPSEGGQATITTMVKEEAPVFVVGQGSDEFETTFNRGSASGSNKVLTSALKRTDMAVRQAVANFLGGMGGGRNYYMNVANDAITYAPCHLACQMSDNGPVAPAMVAEAERVRLLMASDMLFDTRTGTDGKCTKGPGPGCPRGSGRDEVAVLAVAIIACVLLVGMCGLAYFMFYKERKREPLFMSLDDDDERLPDPAAGKALPGLSESVPGNQPPAPSLAMAEIPTIPTISEPQREDPPSVVDQPRSNPMLAQGV